MKNVLYEKIYSSNDVLLLLNLKILSSLNAF